MIFLPGDHTLDTDITVADVARMTMHEVSSLGNIATVVCNGPVNLLYLCKYDAWAYGNVAK